MFIRVFGAMLLLPLYLQAVRGESAFESGLLLAPQGIGAMIAMPIAGKLTDRTGVGRIVIPGLLILHRLDVVGLTPAQRRHVLLGASAVLFVDGRRHGLHDDAADVGRDADAAPAPRSPAPSTTLNIIQQVGASIGTAVMSVILTVALQDRLGGGAGGGHGARRAGADLPLEVRDLMASAFTHTYWWAVALIVPAIVAALLLPRRKPEPVEDEDGAPARRPPVLIHA